MDCSTPGLPVHHQLPEFTQTHVHWVSDATQPSHPLSSPSPAFNLSQHQFFASGGQSIEISASASVLPMNIQDWSLCCPRNSQESSPTPQFKSINSSVLSFLDGPTLISIHDYQQNHSFDCTHFCQQSDVCFLICCLGWSWLFFQGASIFNFMAAVTIGSDFGAQENKVSLFLFFPHLFAMKWWDQIPWS